MSLDLDFGDISGVEPREIPHEESDLEDAVIWRGCHWKVLKKSKYVKKSFGMTLFAGVYQDLAPTAFSGKK